MNILWIHTRVWTHWGVIVVSFGWGKLENYPVVPPSSRFPRLPKFYKLWQMCWGPSQRSRAALADSSHAREQAPVSFWPHVYAWPKHAQAGHGKYWGEITEKQPSAQEWWELVDKYSGVLVCRKLHGSFKGSPGKGPHHLKWQVTHHCTLYWLPVLPCLAVPTALGSPLKVLNTWILILGFAFGGDPY